MTLETVRSAMLRLKEEGKPRTVQAVLEEIGSGSKRDVVRFMRELRDEAAPGPAAHAAGPLTDLMTDTPAPEGDQRMDVQEQTPEAEAPAASPPPNPETAEETRLSEVVARLAALETEREEIEAALDTTRDESAALQLLARDTVRRNELRDLVKERDALGPRVDQARRQRDLGSGQAAYAQLVTQKREQYALAREKFREFVAVLEALEAIDDQQHALLATPDELPPWPQTERRLLAYLLVSDAPQLVPVFWPRQLERPNRQSVDATLGASDRGLTSKVQRVVAYEGDQPRYSINNPPPRPQNGPRPTYGLADGTRGV
jgi:hypothetical protein